MADELLATAESDDIKKQLRKNTANAIETGIVGFPSFQVDGGDLSKIVWGQDKLDVLQDILSGWNGLPLTSKI
jgi:2-hydroxychromene-2-carboxylate isomerase